MPDFNEESYLDSLLKDIDSEKNNQLNNREKYMQHLVEDEKEVEAKPETEEEIEEKIIKQQVEEADQKIKKENSHHLFGRNKNANHQNTVQNQSEQASDKIKEDDLSHDFKHDMDETIELTDSEKARLSDMNLDDLIEDVHTNSASVKDLFKDHGGNTTVPSKEAHDIHTEKDVSKADDNVVSDKAFVKDSAKVSDYESAHVSDNVSDYESGHASDNGSEHLSEKATDGTEQQKDVDRDIDAMQNHIQEDAQEKQASGDASDDVANDAVNEAGIDSDHQNEADANMKRAEKESKLESKKAKKEEKKKKKADKLNAKNLAKIEKKKKDFFGKVKDVFFESLDDEDPNLSNPSVSANGVDALDSDHILDDKDEAAAKSSEDQSVQEAAATSDAEHESEFDDSILDETKDSHKDESKDLDDDLDAELDENEKLLQELYGSRDDDTNAENEEAPKKGFFAKLKFKMAMRRKRNLEAEKAEQEAETKELEEKKEKRETKKAEKEKKKAEKKAAPKKEKKPKKVKEKKPKKVKEPPKPGDILRFKPTSIIFFILFISGVIVLIYISNISLNYTNSINQAELYMQNGNYEKAYQKLAGLDLKDSDVDTYRQVQVVMYVEGQYIAYQNNIKNNEEAKALDNLIKGLERYNTYYNDASELGVTDELDTSRQEIISALSTSFQMSESEGTALMIMMEDDFTQYYNKIQTYER